MKDRKQAWVDKSFVPPSKFPRVCMATNECSAGGILIDVWKIALEIFEDKKKAAACLKAMVDEIAERGISKVRF